MDKQIEDFTDLELIDYQLQCRESLASANRTLTAVETEMRKRVADARKKLQGEQRAGGEKDFAAMQDLRNGGAIKKPA